jgi:RNA polymerase sigma-70 factor, ECF subfamily
MDQELIEQARLGRRAARDALLRQLQDPWYRFCLSQLGDPEAARDATQETALRFLRTLSSFRGQSSITTWSLGIVLNVVREMRRTRKFEALNETENQLAAERSSAGFPSRSNTSGGSPLDSASMSESSDTMHALLNDLPDRQRQALVLRFFESLSVEETAAAMNCAAGTVKATVHQALRALRNKLTSRGQSPRPTAH